MEIKADEEARIAITQLCDIALKSGGLQNYKAIGGILASIKPVESEEPDGGTEQ